MSKTFTTVLDILVIDEANSLVVYVDLEKSKSSYKIVYITPEKILLGKCREEQGLMVLEWLRRLNRRGLISRFVVDEAHCVTTWVRISFNQCV
jgi:bloom syndrome protein